MTTYYVATTGSSGGNGSTSSPFRTISEAMAANLQPGDEVVVRAGTYNESVTMSKDGSAAGYITLRSEVPGGAKIVAPSGGANGININADYVTVDGFEVSGSGSHGIVGQHVHHVNVTNNVSHDNGASGVAFAWSEFMTIDGNVTYNNASSGWFSGISVYQNRNITGDTTTDGFRTIIRNNVSYDNVTKSGAHTDGNGIIIDDLQSTQTSGFPNYTYPTLVENNLVYENGGKGVQVTWSDYVTVRNNTAYHNNQDLQNTGTWRGELSNAQSSNNTWVNNIGVADPKIQSNNTAIDNTSYGDYKNVGVVWDNNLTFNGTAGQASVRTEGGNLMPSAANGNQLGIDPKFLGAASGDFHLGSGSTAINAGTNKYGVGSVDLDGDGRVVGTVDIGSYESGSGSTIPIPTPTPTPTPDEVPTTPTNPETPTSKVYTGTEGNDNMPASGQSNGGNETFKGLGGNDVLKGGAGADALDGGNGTDTATYAGSAAVNVNLATRAATGGHAAGDKVASIENLTGSSYNDVLTGNGDRNVLEGGAGADALDGGTSTDTVTYAGSAAVNVNLATRAATGGHAAGDKFTSIENLTGSSYNDVLTGNGGTNVLNGGAGADALDGGTGTDTVTYAGSAAVNVNLATRAATGGHAAGDKFAGIENLTGSSYNDVLTGDGGSNVLHGCAGADKIVGGAGADKIVGGAGKDILTGGADADTFAFKAATDAGSDWNRDSITDFQKGTDKIDLSAIDANGSAAGDGTFHFIAKDNALFDRAEGALAWHLQDEWGTANDTTVIQADTNGDGVHDFEMQLQGLVNLSASDFML